MKNKGFTLVELLAVIIIIALLGGIGAVAYTSIIKQSEIRSYEAYEKTMHAEVLQLLSKKVELLPRVKKTITLNELMYTYKVIDPINNPRKEGDLCLARSYVEITRVNTSTGLDSFQYKVCLICDDYNNDESLCKEFDN